MQLLLITFVASYPICFDRCIEAAGKATETGFAAIKLTALGRPQFLVFHISCDFKNKFFT